MQYFIMKTTNKQELQQIAFNHSSDIDFKDFMNLYQKCTAETIFVKATLASDNPDVSKRIFYKEYKS